MPTVVSKLLELIRFSHTIFALPFAILAAALAWRDEEFRWQDLLGILLCMMLARSAAMAFNRIMDRHIDAANPRTAGRHLPAGTLRVGTVWAFTLVCCLGFVASTLLFYVREPENPWPLYCSTPVLLFVLGYSLAKRFTSLAHFWLGGALMLAPVAAWVAVKGLTDMTVPLLLGSAVAFWVAGFDILYACQDAKFDTEAGLHSVPARFGVPQSLRIAAVCHAVMFGLLVGLYFASPHLDWVFLAGLVAVGVLLVYEHSLVRADDLTRVNRAFFHVNGVISLGLLAIVLVQLAVK
ncbi:4-hydroxybenzoate polyprenyltransferase : 4-hydroxybenzoate octaprenyltransferase OS=Blastopirellula marina DSM 3645 GN=DSM3645_22029 PE=4 SV=1: UbiA [Gemmata massiliana]|uniref:4-hydroxybenzoate polyprenyltransferase n=1 Tax=Gemmata massiliana TaxID=1210884 RepID=A0A6P2CQJ7_9BACT|nr:UbiA-like polyprenyltransferase [Gemmata massiliana]VTR91173.1 4-hydroxybenzoate polyprenyltransferase : 4-hydroxybenzoate octaprenyltransferase OS=Blastopirellula marina DSM 3645 GN=DSM3645_22029 PE=4 SV=1: UbiA [Gemmata massiliana]